MWREPVIETETLVAGHYRVQQRIGSGAMGVVWRARDERLDRVVAIKQLLLQPGASDAETGNARLRAMREARIAAMLQHPNAVTIYDVAEHHGDPCLVMEYLPARSLAAVLDERGCLAPVEVARIGNQIASALIAAHAKGIVHRDVKPGNILLGEGGIAKITDFGISRAAGDMTLTQTGIVAGTPAYFAPEVAMGQDPTSAADVFSLGSTLYAAVEGEPPFGTSQNPLALLHRVAAGKVTPPRQAGQLTALLMRLLQADPAVRPTMEEVRRGLLAVAGGQRQRPMIPAQSAPIAPQHTRAMPVPEPVAEPEVRTPQLPRLPRRFVVVVASGVALLAVLAVLAVVLLNHGASPQPANAASPAGSGSASTPPPTSEGVTTSVGPAAGTPIDWHSAGVLVIDYYNGMDNLSSTWGMLSADGRAPFGNEAAFDQYWGKFSQVSARNAYGVTKNGDGSVNVPVDVTTGSNGQTSQQHKVLRVARVDGKLRITSDTR
ncbi:MAG: protein kinase domain-containing protein [Sciscionella sp.]